MVLARISGHRTKIGPENGHPLRTPFKELGIITAVHYRTLAAGVECVQLMLNQM